MKGIRVPRAAFFAISAIFAATLALAHPARAGDIDSLLEKIPQNWIQKAIDDLNVSFSSKLLSTNVLKGLNLNLTYAYSESPAYRDSLYTRVDQWELGSTLSPLSWTKALGSAIYLDIEPGTQIVFVRQFPTEKEALLALPSFVNPFDLKNIPFTAKSALENLKPGDAVMLPVTLNLLLGAQAVQNLGIFQLTEPAELVASGEYEIVVVRLPKDRIRMRIIAMKSKGADSKPTAQIANLKVFKLNLLNKGLEQVVGKNLLQGSFADMHGQLFILDYMFDLDDKDAAAAYDSIFASNFTLRALNQLENAGDPTDQNVEVISDLTKAEKLVREDAQKPMDQRRVAQILEATDNYSEISKDINSGFHLIGFDFGSSDTTHAVTFIDSGDQKQNYLLPIYRKNFSWNALFNLFGHSRVYTGSTLYDLPDGGSGVENGAPRPPSMQDPQFSDEIITLEVKDNELSVSARKALSRQLRMMISPSILSQVDFSMWNTQDDILGSRVYAQVIFRAEALAALANLPEDRLREQLDAYLRANHLGGLIPQWYEHYAWDDEERQWVADGQKLSNPRTTEFIDDLAYILDSHQDAPSRIARFAKLRENPVFVKAGCGFLMDLLKGQNLANMLYVQVQLDGRGHAPVRFSYGDPLSDRVYAAMEYIQNVIDNGAFDLRLQTFGDPFTF